MKIKTNKGKETDKWSLSGDPITVDDFKSGIKEVEKDPFFTIEESKKIIKEWRRQKDSL